MRSCGLFVTEQSENNLRDTYVDTRKLFTTYECSRGGESNGGGDAGDESRPRPAWELLTTVPLSSHQVDINYSVADEQFIGVIIVYHRFTRRAEIFQKFRPIDHYIATRYSISLTMLEPLRELSAAQFPSFLLHELIVEQGMFKLYYISTFVLRY